jgi:cysteine synthase
MQLPTILQGRPFGPEQLEQIRALIGQNPDWTRYRLSREVAVRWNWRTARGQLKDMAARTLLLKLQEKGWIRPPAPVPRLRTGRGSTAVRLAGVDAAALAGGQPWRDP